VLMLAFSATSSTEVLKEAAADESSLTSNQSDNDNDYTAQTCPSSMPSGACRASISSSSPTPQKKKQQQLECSVYMAPSTVGGSEASGFGGNLGIYSGIPLEEGDVLNFPEIAVPLMFREWHEHPPGYNDGKIFDK
jgi:hypothetical protein